ncbi:MAG: hypothetical protein O2948_09435 [Proteobacteria bacterium]|nr:hypothetical protein [Pseudomonadota bacterium]MDA0928299.1 hypothetical protein [Pseudomonadota bacterium]
MTTIESRKSKKSTTHLLSLAHLLAGLPLLIISLMAQAQENSPDSSSNLAYSQQSAVMLPSVSTELLSEEFNPFDDQQLEDLVVAARQQQEAGAHAVALRFFEQAWQVSRVAYGLYHESQVPLLESMIASQIELEDWQAIDEHYGYIELIYTRLYEIDDPRLETGLQKVSSWHINAFNVNVDGKREEHLRKARQVLKTRLEVAELTLPEGDPRFAFLNESIRLSEQHLYLMSERYKMMIQKQQQAAREGLLATLD